ncbi:MAG: serpin family protein [archaeon]|nr:serpin family protein [archaeon]
MEPNLQQSQSNFQFQLLSEISNSNTKGNISISPYSIFHSLVLLSNGAKNEALTEILQFLGKESSESLNQNLLETNQKLKDSELNSFQERNAVFSKLPLKEKFKEICQRLNSHFEELKDKNQINNWCELATNGKIKKILDTLSEEDRLILLNIVNFKAEWKYEFRDFLGDGKDSFFNFGNQKKKVPFMFVNEHEFYYYSNKDLEMIKLPYKDSEFSMFILMPDKKINIEGFLKGFNVSQFNTLRKKMKLRKVDLSIPKFEISFDVLLQDYFKKMGIVSPFTPDGNLDGLCENTEYPLFISQFKQKCIIKVDTKGTEASTATLVKSSSGASLKRDVIKMKVDGPFIFIIKTNWDEFNFAFLGKVVKL